jgi:hypothetical protein
MSKPEFRTAKSASAHAAQINEIMPPPLPGFARRSSSGFIYWWEVTPTGNYARDAEMGQRFAADFIDYQRLLRRMVPFVSLGSIAMAQAACGGDFDSQIRFGFWETIELAMEYGLDLMPSDFTDWLRKRTETGRRKLDDLRRSESRKCSQRARPAASVRWRRPRPARRQAARGAA